MIKPLSKMTTEELKSLEVDIRNRKRELEYESKKIVYQLYLGHYVEEVYREEDYCKAMDKVIEIAEKAKEEFKDLMSDKTLSVDYIRATLLMNIPITKMLTVPESEYEGYFK